MQTWIEAAWDQGINQLGRQETGGIKGTRKWIGTPEVSTLLRYLDISFDVVHINDQPRGPTAAESVLTQIEDYFKGAAEEGQLTSTGATVYKTHLAPIYLQRPGHSMTVVGIERHKNGSRTLLVLDPMFNVPEGVKTHLGVRRPNISTSKLQKLLHPFRRDVVNFSKYVQFEMIM